MTTSLSSIPRPQAVQAALPILLRQLRLAQMRCHWQSIASQAEAEGWSHSQFLYALCEQEMEQRQQRLLRSAQLPWSKALADYDPSGRIEAGPWQELEALSRQSEWLQRGENVLLWAERLFSSETGQDRFARQLPWPWTSSALMRWACPRATSRC